ncbi:hypothetical protein [Nostoc sp. KVJ3]|uniref:hypothetical protein n=1 Tax=Nostoc sp. KVJ3 TaxID=457945 RepID=UPI0022383764|nr:hypothetical protein [Nostoc sp. KVJ3]
MNRGDFETTVGKLLLLEPNLLSQLQPALLVLHQLLTQQLKSTDRYGFDDASIRALLPLSPQA